MNLKLSISTLLITLLFTTLLLAEDPGARHWPRWRGPDGSGSADTGTYAVKFNATEGLVWKAELPGRGHSTPIVWGDNIVITASADGEDAVLNFDWSGKMRWTTKIGSKSARAKRSSGANPSAVTDGKLIFVYYKSGAVACVDFAGKLLWKKNIQEMFGKDTLYHDLGTSPVLTNNFVVIAKMDTKKGVLVAFEKKTGRRAWKVDRNYPTPAEGDHSYASPIVMERDGKQVILVWGAEHLTAHDATNGKLIWDCGDFNPTKKRNWVIVGSPVVIGDMAVMSYGRGSRLAGVKLGGAGDVTKTHRLWDRGDTGSFCPSLSAHGGKVYMLGDEGQIECIDPKTGKSLWSTKLPRASGKFRSSPMVAGNKLYMIRDSGVVYVADISGEFKLISTNHMGERILACPVPVADRLLIRGEKHLFCVGSK